MVLPIQGMNEYLRGLSALAVCVKIAFAYPFM